MPLPITVKYDSNRPLYLLEYLPYLLGHMHRFREILLSVWRETCRHIDLSESVRTVAPLLAERLPLEAVIVRRLDPQHQSLETIVAAGAEGSLPPQIGRTPCSDARFKRL